MKQITKSIYEKIVELSDLELQKKLWLNEDNDTGQISSYIELMSSLFDDYNFDNFIDNEAIKEGIPVNVILNLNKLRTLLNDYKEKDTDYKIINDPQWDIIVKQAKLILQIWCKEKEIG